MLVAFEDLLPVRMAWDQGQYTTALTEVPDAMCIEQRFPSLKS